MAALPVPGMWDGSQDVGDQTHCISPGHGCSYKCLSDDFVKRGDCSVPSFKLALGKLDPLLLSGSLSKSYWLALENQRLEGHSVWLFMEKNKHCILKNATF